MNKQSPRSEFGVSRRDLVNALRRLRRGDFTVRLPEDGNDDDGEIATLFNEVVGLNQQITEEFERLSKVVGKEGKIGQRARVRGATRRLGHQAPRRQRADRRHGPADRRSRARHRRGRQGRPVANA